MSDKFYSFIEQLKELISTIKVYKEENQTLKKENSILKMKLRLWINVKI